MIHAATIVMAMLAETGAGATFPAYTVPKGDLATVNEPLDEISCPRDSTRRLSARNHKELSESYYWDMFQKEYLNGIEKPEGYSPPQMLRPPTIRYPKGLFGSMKPGFVSIAYVIDSTGRVINPKVVCSSNSRFEAAALDAVHSLSYRPASVYGKPVAEIVIQPFDFASE